MNKLLAILREGFGSAERSKLQVSPVKPDKNQGINVKHWFWAALDELAPKGKKESRHEDEENPNSSNPPASPTSSTSPEEVIAKNPQISAATLLNTLKAEGYEITKKEADASSAFAAQTREAARPTEQGRNGFSFRTRLVEASYKDDGIGATKFRVILLKEGMGNSRDAYYYSREALVSAVPVFEGKKIYSDHPSLSEEEVRPERSVRDILGYFEGVGVEEQPDGCMALVGDVNIMPDKPYEWARALLRNAVDYAKKFPDKEFVGLSINANGDAKEADINEVLRSAPDGAKEKLSKALEAGTSSVKVVSKIDEAVSCDLVTEAGAGGKIISLLEADAMFKKKIKESEKVEEAKGLAPGMKEDESKEALPPKKDEPEAKDEEKKEAAPEHDDEEQDKALIKKMLDQHLGKEGYGEEECASAHEAMKCAMAAGEEKEAAMQMAGHAMKMAKYMSAKKEADAMEAKESEETKESDKEEEKKESHKESAEFIKLKGENAKLKESLAKIDLEKHLDATLRESGLRMEITKKFRDIIGTPKSKAEIDKNFKLFVEGYKTIGGEADSDEWFATATEKTATQFSENGLVDLSDC